MPPIRLCGGRLSLNTRLNFVRSLLDAGHLAVAREVLTVAFTDRPNRKSVNKLSAVLGQLIQKKLDVLLEAAQQALASNSNEEALASDRRGSRDCVPDLDYALLLRGRTQSRLGGDFAALLEIAAAHVTDSHPGPAFRGLPLLALQEPSEKINIQSVRHFCQVTRRPPGG